LVGCGQQKLDTDEPVPAEDLYTSTYFQLKKRYAGGRSDEPEDRPGWAILSAEHDVLFPGLEVEPYNTTIDDLEGEPSPVEPEAYQHTSYPWDEPFYHDRLDFWTRRVHYGLASWLGMKSGFPEEKPHCRRLIVLAGEDYIEPLQENNVFDPFPWETRFPFQEQDFSGIGEQMAWLKEEAEFYEELHNRTQESRQTAVQSYSEPDLDVPEVDGQSDWDDWMAENSEGDES